MGNKNIIELNGKTYDANTGELLGIAAIPHKVTHTKVYPKGHTGRTIDVFTRASARAKPSKNVGDTNSANVIASSAATAAKPDVMPTAQMAAPRHRNAHQPAQHAQARKPESSKLLMRSSVKKPGASFKKQITVQTELTRKVPAVVVPKLSVNSISPSRESRARAVERSHHVSHYAQPAFNIKTHVAPLAVQPAPPNTPRPDISAPRPRPTNNPKPIDIFEQAIAEADHFVDITAHKARFKKQLRRHVASMAAGALALVVLGGFLAYQNVPGVQLKVASMQAGFSTRMPDFKAAGFAYNGVQHQSGQLTIGFSGGGGHYQLIQQQTNWTPDEMIQNVSSTNASGTPNYKTVTDGNTTIYRLADNDATWVANGKWYQVNGTGTLSDYQLKTLASNV